jgi:hypothetical protein
MLEAATTSCNLANNSSVPVRLCPKSNLGISVYIKVSNSDNKVRTFSFAASPAYSMPSTLIDFPKSN